MGSGKSGHINFNLSSSRGKSFSPERRLSLGSRLFFFIAGKTQGIFDYFIDFLMKNITTVSRKELSSFCHDETFISPLASVHPKARLGKNVHVEAYSVIGENVSIGDYTHIKNHVIIHGETKIGTHCLISPFVVLGHEPQHLKHKGKTFPVIIGNHVHIREHCTLHQGTLNNTEVGDYSLLMVGCHLGHDCRLGRHVVLSNQVGLAGHVVVDDYSVIGGMTGVHQRVHIGKGSMVGGFSALVDDVIPYGMVLGNRAHLEGINLHRLKHLGFSKKEIHEFYRFYRYVFQNQQGTLQERLKTLNKDLLLNPCVKEAYEFIFAKHRRSLALPKK